MDVEIFKAVAGYEGSYEVSNHGRIRSLLKNKILKTWLTNGGYEQVHLYSSGKRKAHSVHILVAV
jgi:hypothetical protein